MYQNLSIWSILKTFPLTLYRVLKLNKIFTADSVSFHVYRIHDKFKKLVECYQKSFWFSQSVIVAMAKNHDFDSMIISQCQFINHFNNANFWVTLCFMEKMGSFWALKCHNFSFACATDSYELSFFSIFYCASSEIKIIQWQSPLYAQYPFEIKVVSGSL